MSSKNRYEFIGLDNLENNRGLLRDLFERKNNEMSYRKLEERTIFPRQAWHRGRQELSSQMAKWRLLCCYFNRCRLHAKGYLDRWCTSTSGHALPKKDPTFTRASAQAAQPSAGQDEEACWDCHLNTGPLDLLGSVKTAGLLFLSFELLSSSPKTQHKACIYL